jgi:hypothetical protein
MGIVETTQWVSGHEPQFEEVRVRVTNVGRTQRRVGETIGMDAINLDLLTRVVVSVPDEQVVGEFVPGTRVRVLPGHRLEGLCGTVIRVSSAASSVRPSADVAMDGVPAVHSDEGIWPHFPFLLDMLAVMEQAPAPRVAGVVFHFDASEAERLPVMRGDSIMEQRPFVPTRNPPRAIEVGEAVTVDRGPVHEARTGVVQEVRNFSGERRYYVRFNDAGPAFAWVGPRSIQRRG